MSPGARVREARKARGLTQKVLAKLAGCSQQTIVDLETGNVEWSRFMPAIADELGVSMHWIESGEGPRERPNKSQGAVPIVQWDYFAQATITGEEPEVLEWIEGCPVDNSGEVVVVIVDAKTRNILKPRSERSDVNHASGPSGSWGDCPRTPHAPVWRSDRPRTRRAG